MNIKHPKKPVKRRRPARRKIRRTEERNLAIMEKYSEVIYELGSLASSVSMKAKYTMVADAFFLTPKTVANIISKMLRESGANRTI